MAPHTTTRNSPRRRRRHQQDDESYTPVPRLHAHSPADDDIDDRRSSPRRTQSDPLENELVLARVAGMNGRGLRRGLQGQLVVFDGWETCTMCRGRYLLTHGDRGTPSTEENAISRPTTSSQTYISLGGPPSVRLFLEDQPPPPSPTPQPTHIVQASPTIPTTPTRPPTLYYHKLSMAFTTSTSAPTVLAPALNPARFLALATRPRSRPRAASTIAGGGGGDWASPAGLAICPKVR